MPRNRASNQPRRQTRYQQRRQRGNTKAIIVFGLLVLVLAGLGFTNYMQKQNTRPTDKVMLCPTDSAGPAATTVILVDRTDLLSTVQQAAIRERLKSVKDSLPKFGELKVYSVGSTDTDLLKPEFAMCNPGRGKEISEITGNPKLVEKQWANLFDTPLQAIFDSMVPSESSKTSPIMESIQSLSINAFPQTPETKDTPRKLIVISDLLQHGPEFSQYHGTPSLTEFKKLPFYQKVRGDLTGVEVEFWYVKRKATLPQQEPKHIEFWQAYLADEGATVDPVWLVPGLN